MNCPIIWILKLQECIRLSTIETEYFTLSRSMKELTPFTGLAKDLSLIFDKDKMKSKVKCTLFEDNNGALELAKTPKYRLRTKHIALKYYHFRNSVKEGRVENLVIYAAEQITDVFTKPLDTSIF